MRDKIGLLRRAPVFTRLAERELGVVAGYSEYRTFKKGEIVFGEGCRSKALYVIENGAVLIRKTAEGEAGKDLAKFIEGESFGELDLLNTDPMSAAAVAEEDATLLVFPDGRTPLADIIDRHPDVFATVLNTLLAMVAGRIRTANKLISEKAPWIQDLRKQILSDKLTGIFNCTYLEEELSSLFARAGDRGSLLMVKPDNFKRINDACGHETGDRVLKAMAEVIKGAAGEGAVAVRYRGDEFAVAFPGAGMESAGRIGERIREALRGMEIGRLTGMSGFSLTASIGAVEYPTHSADCAGLAPRAHALMLEARSEGGDRLAKPGTRGGS